MNILYFPRKYNDTDNIVPILYLLLENHQSMNLYVYNLKDNYSIFYDSNINFIKSSFPSRVKLYSKSLSLMRRLYLAIKSLYCSLRSGKEKADFSCTTLESVVQENEFKLAVFDHTQDDNYISQTGMLKKYSIPTVSLPHGVRVTINQLRINSDYCMDRVSRRVAKSIQIIKCFDHVCYTDDIYLNKLKSLCIEEGLDHSPLNSIHLIGSLRYSKYWLDKKEIYEPSFRWPANKRRVVLFPSKPKRNVHWDEFLRCLTMMSNTKNMFFIVSGLRDFKNKIPADHDNILVTDQYCSSSLIQSADAVMFWGTSVVFEAMARNKPCIYLAYLHSNYTMFDIYNAAWKVDTRDEFHKCLRSLDDMAVNFEDYASAPEKDKLMRKVIYNYNDSAKSHEEANIRFFDGVLHLPE